MWTKYYIIFQFHQIHIEFFFVQLVMNWKLICKQKFKKVRLNTVYYFNFQEILLFNLREEPVLFVENASDMLPYSIREKENLKKLVNLGRSSWEADEAEARIRKEVGLSLLYGNHCQRQPTTIGTLC